MHFTPAGESISAEEWERLHDQWLPSESDQAYVTSLMQPVHEAGKIAQWIAPPSRGINSQDLDYEYVRLDPK
jgi:benzoyl-CoA 2,3-dioxygenase component B